MKVLILEDSDERIAVFKRKLFKHQLDIVKHAYEAVKLLGNNMYDLIFLDHDLNGKQIEYDKEDCGMVVAEYLRDNNITTRVIIHSFNPIASQNMLAILPNATYQPAAWNLIQ